MPSNGKPSAARAVERDMSRFPPGPDPITAFRGMLPARGMAGFPTFFRETARRYGPIASARVGRRRFYYISEPAAVEEVLVTEGRSYVKGRGTQRLERLLGKGLLTSNGALHLRQRRLVQPAFHRETDRRLRGNDGRPRRALRR